MDDLNNVNYNELSPETKKPKEDVKEIIKPTLSYSLESIKLLDKIKQGSSTSSPSNFSLDSHSLLDKIIKNHKTDEPEVNNEFKGFYNMKPKLKRLVIHLLSQH